MGEFDRPTGINPDHFYQTLTRWLAHARPAAMQPPAAGTRAASAVELGNTPIEIPGFATADTMDRLAGDVSLYHRVLEMLAPSLTAAMVQFDTAVKAGDHTGTRSAVHSIRGMAANVGAVALSRYATELEQMINERRAHPEQLTAFHALVEQTLLSVEQSLAERKLVNQAAL